MFYVSELKNTPPDTFANLLQERIYGKFGELEIPFGRVDTDPGITMEDCLNIDRGIGGRIVKTVFLCNRQQTSFYIYAMSPDKPFVTKDFCHSLNIPRVSFAPEDKLIALAGTIHGAATILSACLESAKDVTFVLDRTVLEDNYFCCTDGTATGFVKLRTSDLLDKFLPSCGHMPVMI